MYWWYAIRSSHDDVPKLIQYLQIAHGHTLRAFTKRWLRYPLDFPLSMVMESGAVGVLSYQHHCVDEPALMLGTSFGGR